MSPAAPLDQLSAEGRLVVGEFVRRRVPDPRRFCLDIDPADEMYLFPLETGELAGADDAFLRYLESGKMMLEELRPVVEAAFGGFDRIDSLLEFACGHGRLTRFLVQEVPRERLTVADIDAEAVAFQQSHFGIRSRVSTADPADYDDDCRYRLILVCSLFSHLPAATFVGWLGRLYRLLTDDGVLAFSVHDEAVLPEGLEPGANGMVFVEQSESHSLDPRQYGTAFVSERFASAAIADACPGAADHVRIPKGLWRFQDLYVVARDGGTDISQTGAIRGPHGYLDRCRPDSSGSRFSLEGWAFDPDDGSVVERVEVSAGDAILETCRTGLPRPDVAAHFGDARAAASGWTCTVEREQVGANDIIGVTVVSSSGRSWVVALDTLGRLARTSS